MSLTIKTKSIISKSVLAVGCVLSIVGLILMFAMESTQYIEIGRWMVAIGFLTIINVFFYTMTLLFDTSYECSIKQPSENIPIQKLKFK